MMNVGDRVRITKCETCSKIVGKTAKVKELFTSETGENVVRLNFGKGRPLCNRPEAVSVDDVSLVEEEEG